MRNKNISCVVRKKVVEYFVAITPNGEEIEIRGVDKSNLSDGQILKGAEIYTEVQDKYTDGSYARSYHVEHYLEVNED